MCAVHAEDKGKDCCLVSIHRVFVNECNDCFEKHAGTNNVCTYPYYSYVTLHYDFHLHFILFFTSDFQVWPSNFPYGSIKSV